MVADGFAGSNAPTLYHVGRRATDNAAIADRGRASDGRVGRRPADYVRPDLRGSAVLDTDPFPSRAGVTRASQCSCGAQADERQRGPIFEQGVRSALESGGRNALHGNGSNSHREPGVIRGMIVRACIYIGVALKSMFGSNHSTQHQPLPQDIQDLLRSADNLGQSADTLAKVAGRQVSDPFEQAVHSVASRL